MFQRSDCSFRSLERQTVRFRQHIYYCISMSKGHVIELEFPIFSAIDLPQTSIVATGSLGLEFLWTCGLHLKEADLPCNFSKSATKNFQNCLVFLGRAAESVATKTVVVCQKNLWGTQVSKTKKLLGSQTLQIQRQTQTQTGASRFESTWQIMF